MKKKGKLRTVPDVVAVEDTTNIPYRLSPPMVVKARKLGLENRPIVFEVGPVGNCEHHDCPQEVKELEDAEDD